MLVTGKLSRRRAHHRSLARRYLRSLAEITVACFVVEASTQCGGTTSASDQLPRFKYRYPILAVSRAVKYSPHPPVVIPFGSAVHCTFEMPNGSNNRSCA